MPALICSLLIPSSDRGIIFNSLFGNKVSPDLIAWDSIAVCIASMFCRSSCCPYLRKIRFLSVSRLHCNGNICCCVLLLLYLTSDKTREHIKEIDAPYKRKRSRHKQTLGLSGKVQKYRRLFQWVKLRRFSAIFPLKNWVIQRFMSIHLCGQTVTGFFRFPKMPPRKNCFCR